MHTTDAEDSDDDPLPTLVDESSDDGGTSDYGENHSTCSSDIDDTNMRNLFKDHFEAEHHLSSDAESAESTEDPKTNTAITEPCMVCSKPTWCSTFLPQNYHCRDYCMHNAEKHDHNDNHHDAPVMKLDEPESTLPALISALMPPEIEEIAAQSAKDATARRMSKKNLKKLARALVPELQRSETKPLPAAAASHAWYSDGKQPTGAVPGQQHREKQAEVGNQLDPLIAWYSLVAKPIPRKLWASMPKAQAAIDAEWAKLRACDDGRGTWDESTVCSYWEAQRQAKRSSTELECTRTSARLFDLCVEKASELEESKRRYKGRVVFGGHRIHDEFGLAAEFPEQGSGACMISASKLCDAVAMLPGCERRTVRCDLRVHPEQAGHWHEGALHCHVGRDPQKPVATRVGKGRYDTSSLPAAPVAVRPPDEWQVLGEPLHRETVEVQL